MKLIGFWAIGLAVAAAGCESAHVGMGVPVPGPVHPSVGVSVNRSGVRGTGGLSTRIGPAPIYAGGSTKPIRFDDKPKKMPAKTKKSATSQGPVPKKQGTVPNKNRGPVPKKQSASTPKQKTTKRSATSVPEAK